MTVLVLITKIPDIFGAPIYRVQDLSDSAVDADFDELEKALACAAEALSKPNPARARIDRC